MRAQLNTEMKAKRDMERKLVAATEEARITREEMKDAKRELLRAKQKAKESVLEAVAAATVAANSQAPSAAMRPTKSQPSHGGLPSGLRRPPLSALARQSAPPSQTPFAPHVFKVKAASAVALAAGSASARSHLPSSPPSKSPRPSIFANATSADLSVLGKRRPSGSGRPIGKPLSRERGSENDFVSKAGALMLKKARQGPQG